MSLVKNVSCVRNRSLAQEKVTCLNNIVALIIESKIILKNSGTRLSKKEKQRLRELWQSRWNNIYSILNDIYGTLDP